MLYIEDPIVLMNKLKELDPQELKRIKRIKLSAAIDELLDLAPDGITISGNGEDKVVTWGDIVAYPSDDILDGLKDILVVCALEYNYDMTREQSEGVECRKDIEVIDEIPGAYKSLDDVMEAQKDLVDIKHTLKQILCVKG